MDRPRRTVTPPAASSPAKASASELLPTPASPTSSPTRVRRRHASRSVDSSSIRPTNEVGTPTGSAPGDGVAGRRRRVRTIRRCRVGGTRGSEHRGTRVGVEVERVAQQTDRVEPRRRASTGFERGDAVRADARAFGEPLLRQPGRQPALPQQRSECLPPRHAGQRRPGRATAPVRGLGPPRRRTNCHQTTRQVPYKLCPTGIPISTGDSPPNARSRSTICSRSSDPAASRGRSIWGADPVS